MNMESLCLRDSHYGFTSTATEFGRQLALEPARAEALALHPSLASLPPELLSYILESIPRHPFRERKSTLASVCRVNRLFLELARPLLFREVHLDLSEGRKWIEYEWSEYADVTKYDTLFEVSRACGKSIKRMRVTFDPANDDLDPVTVLKDVFSHLQLRNLEAVRIDWSLFDEFEHLEQWEIINAESAVEELLLRLVQDAERLESLKIVHVSLSQAQTARILSSFPNLETLTGRLAFPLPESQRPVSLPRLRHLALGNPLTLSTFSCVIQPLADSLVSLAIHINPCTGALDLAQLSHLTTLELLIDICSIGDRGSSSASATSVPESVPFDRRIRTILQSSQSLPIRTLALTSPCSHYSDRPAPVGIFDLLPPSIVALSIVPEYVNPEVDRQSISRLLAEGQLPLLEKVSITAPNVPDWHSAALWSEGREARDVLAGGSYDRNIEFEMRWTSGARLGLELSMNDEYTDSEAEKEIHFEDDNSYGDDDLYSYDLSDDERSF